ncbi:MAG TPA: ribonuclease HIII [bacterium]|nr:ribonuclease HIII [bacterium]
MAKFSPDPILDAFVEKVYTRLVAELMTPLPESFKELPYGVSFRVILPGEKEFPIALYHSDKKGFSIVTPSDRLRRLILGLLAPDALAGCDEAGKGDIFGPLVAASFYLCDASQGALGLGVRDSKKMSDAEVLAAADELNRTYRRWFEVVRIMPKRYNELYADFKKKGRTLNHLLAWAHSKALGGLAERHPDMKKVLVDQFSDAPALVATIRAAAPNAAVEFQTRAEAHPAVALASVIARADYLRSLKRISEETLGGAFTLKSGSGADADTLIAAIGARLGTDVFAEIAKLHFANFSRGN